MNTVVPPSLDVPSGPQPQAPDEPGSDVDEHEHNLYDEDDEDDNVDLAPFKAPDGWRLVATPPSASALEFSRGDSAPGDELAGRMLLFNWTAVGWCVGTVTRRNKDARRKLDGEHCNFFCTLRDCQKY